MDSLKPIGVFVKLPNGQTGLLHISQCALEESGPGRTRELYRKFPLHSKVEVVVKEVNGDRISLTLPEVAEAEAEKDILHNYNDEGSAGFGSLGGLFDNLKL